MAESLVLDSSAILAEIKGEPGMAKAREIRAKVSGKVRMHAVNACEIASVLMRLGLPRELSLELATPNGVEIVETMDSRLWQRTAILKSMHKCLSLGDCVVISLAEHFDSDILTGDRRFSEAETTAARIFFR